MSGLSILPTIQVKDEGVSKGRVSIVDFVGAGVAATVSGGTATITIGGGGGGASLDTITAAAADQAGIANGDWNIRWNWAKTTNSEVAFEFGESAASTNGTSTSGVPNQVLLKLSTVAASTMSPLSVYSRAAHVFSVSPTTAQILAATGTASAPAYSFAANTNSGMVGVVGTPAQGLGFAHGGTTRMVVGTSQVYVQPGSNSTYGLSDITNQVMGLSWNINGAASVCFIDNTSPAIRPFEVITDRTATGTNIMYQGGATTTGALLHMKKSRASTAGPTAITTGDDLGVIGAYGYVGATGTYVEAARITFDSTGTIADNSTGVGGIVRFSTRAVGGAVTEAFNVQGGTVPQILAADGAFGNAMYSFAGNVAMGMMRSTNNIWLLTGSSTGNFSALNTSGNTLIQADSTGIACGASGGSVTAPAYYYINDRNTGIFFPAAENMAVACNGQEIVRWKNSSTGGGWQIMDEADSDPTTTELDAADSMAIYMKNNKLVVAHNVAGTINYATLALDGSSTAWTQSSAAP